MYESIVSELLPEPFYFFSVSYVEERPWWPIQSPIKGSLANLKPPLNHSPTSSSSVFCSGIFTFKMSKNNGAKPREKEVV